MKSNDFEPHWLNVVVDLLMADTIDLRQLARIAGRSPERFYRGADLRGADLRGQDLRGIDLDGANLSNVLLDKSTRIDTDILKRVAYISSDENRAREELISSHLDSAVSNDGFKPSTVTSDELPSVLSFANDLIRQGKYQDTIRFLTSYREIFGKERDFVLKLGEALERIHAESALAF
jgi:hypothetical protein